MTDAERQRGARGDRRRGPGLHELPSAPDPDAGRARRGRPGDRGRVRRRRPGLQRGPRGPAVHRPGRRPARQAPGVDRLAPRGRVHHQRREVPAAGQPGPAARRDRRLRAVPAPPAGGPRPGRGRDPRSVLDGDVHARRPDLAGARHGPAGRSRDGRGVDAVVFAMYHPAAALRTPSIERESYADIAAVPTTLLASRRRREAAAAGPATDTSDRRAGPGAATVEPPTAEPTAVEPPTASATPTPPSSTPSHRRRPCRSRARTTPHHS